jgi:hypothetical protein
MAIGPGAWNTDMAKRVNSEHLFRMGKLVRYLNEDIESSRMGVCETPLNGPIWAILIGLGRMAELR